MTYPDSSLPPRPTKRPPPRWGSMSAATIADGVVMVGGLVVFVALAFGLGDVGAARTNFEWDRGWPRLMPRALWGLFAVATVLVALSLWRAVRDRGSDQVARRRRLQLTALASAALVTGGEWLYWSTRPVVCGSVDHSNPNYPHFVRCWSDWSVPPVHTPAPVGGLVVLIVGLAGAAVAGMLWMQDHQWRAARPVSTAGALATLAGGLGILLGPLGLFIGPLTLLLAGIQYRIRDRNGPGVAAFVLAALAIPYALAWINIWLSQHPFALFI